MPRMRVNLRPSTVQFDDGEDPVIGGLARFGTAMANLPVQIGRIRMEQARDDEHKREFDAEQSLRMNADARAQDEHGLSMKMGHGKAIEEGYETPAPPDGDNITADQMREAESAKYGRDHRQAELDALRYRASDPHANGQWMPIPADKMGDPRKLYNTKTHEMVDVDPQEAAPVAAAPVKPVDTGHWWDSIANAWSAKGQPSAFNTPGHVPLRMGANPTSAQRPSDTPGGVDPYEEAKRQYDQGNHMPMKDLLQRDPKARARAQAEVDAAKPSRLQPPTMSGLSGWMSGAGGASD